jgi:hypothetical protein
MANDVWDVKSNLRIQYNDGTSWVSIQADSYTVDIDRGINVEQGVFARPDVGNAKVQMVKKSLSDLITGPAYKSNMPFRIQYQPAPDSAPTVYNTIFYGFIQNIGMSYLNDAQKLGITITAYDASKILLNSRVSSFVISGTTTARSFKNLMADLATTINTIDTRVTLAQSANAGSLGSSTYQIAQTFVDAKSGEILNQMLDAELGWCWASRTGANQWYLTRLDIDSLQGKTWSSSAKTVSNVHSTSTNHYCMDSIDLTYDSDRIVNKVKVKEVGNPDSGAAGSSPASDKTATNSTSVTNYGAQVGNFEITMDPGTSPYTRVSDWATAVANMADPKSIGRVTCPALRRDGKMSNVADTEIADALQIEFSDGTNTIQQISLVSRIGHSITADHWEVTLDLWKGI